MEEAVSSVQRSRVRLDMERFFGDEENPEFKFDDDEFGTEFETDFELEEEAIAYIDKQDLLDVMHMDLAQSELNNAILSKAIEISQKSIFWYFRSSEYKRKEIEANYRWLLNLTDDEVEIDEGE